MISFYNWYIFASLMEGNRVLFVIRLTMHHLQFILSDLKWCTHLRQKSEKEKWLNVETECRIIEVYFASDENPG